MSRVSPPLASRPARPAATSTDRRSSARPMLSSRTRSAPAATASPTCSTVSHSTSTDSPGNVARTAWKAARTPPAASTWLSLTSAASDSDIRWLTPPPQRTAYFSRARRPGVVLRVSRIRDTRKTTPGLRALEKYAVRCGGGVNHRMSLSDAALVKDNHVLAAGGVRAAFQAVRATFPGLSVEVECDTVEQVGEAVAAGADLVLLDNMGLAELRRSVEVAAGRAGLEASGGLTLDMAYAVAATGVDYLAIGALTHSAPALDIGVDSVSYTHLRAHETRHD